MVGRDAKRVRGSRWDNEELQWSLRWNNGGGATAAVMVAVEVVEGRVHAKESSFALWP